MTSLRLARHSLKTRITFVTLTIFVLSIWSLAFYASRMLREDMVRVLGQQQFSTVTILADQVDDAVQDRLSVLKAIAAKMTPPMMGNAAALQAEIENRPALESMFNAGAYVVSIDGQTIASLPVSVGRVGLNYMDQAHVATALKEGKATLSKPHIGKALKTPVLGMATPVLDAQGKVIGALVGVIDLSKPNFLSKIAGVTYGKTGSYLIVAPQDRLVITATDKSRIMQKLPAPGVSPGIDRFIQACDGSAVYRGVSGVDQLASCKRMPFSGWDVEAVLPTEEAFAPIHDMQQRMLLAAIFLTLLAGGLTWWMLRRELSPMLATVEMLGTLSVTSQPQQPLPITRQDEIGDLIGGFNRLLEALGQRENALKESEENLAITLHSIGDAVIATDPAGRVTRMNTTAERLSGWTLADAMGHPLAEVFRIIDAATREPAIDPVQLVMEHGQVVGLANHTVLLARDGKEYQIADSAAPIRNAAGEIVGVALVFSDVTEKYRAEEVLHLTRFSVEAASDSLFWMTPDARIVDVNAAACHALGYTREELLQLGVPDVDAHYNAQLWPQHFAELRQRGSLTFESEQRTKDGRLFPVEIVANYVKHGNEERNCAFVRDITERKRAEAELEMHRNHLEELVITRTAELAQAKEDAETSEHFMQVITDGIPGMIAYCNPELRYEFANKAYREWFGKSAEEISGAHLRDVLDEGLFQKNLPFFNAALRGEPQVFQRTLLDPEGNPTHKWVSYLPDFKAEQVQGFFVLVSDITELKNTQLQLEQLNEQLQLRTVQAEAANRTKSIFLANMSHELRTPMNGVMGMIDLVLRRATDPQQIDWLNKSKRSAKHLLEVINDILDISKIESERLILEEMNFSLPQTIDEVLQMQEAPAQAKGLRLSCEISPSLPDVLCGDPMRLRQILLNFTGNAIKFSEHGEITVSVRAEAEDKHSVLLRIEVTDQGIGISAEQQDRLFHAFTQADGSMNRKYGGSGLGLIISKRMALLMGGDAGVISEEGSGSTFWATVRLKKYAKVVASPSPEKVDAEALIGQRYCGHRILVVDDEPINLEISRLQLEAVDLVVDTVEDGAEAVAMARTNSYAAIFMDMQMPKLNGLEATQQIRQLPGYRDTPIIAMTANAFAEDKAKCLEAGMNDFLIKPFYPDELFGVLLRSLSRSEA